MKKGFKFKGYVKSKDYELLAELAKQQSIVCIIKESDGRAVAHTQYILGDHCEELWLVRSRRRGFVTSCSKEEFVLACESHRPEGRCF